MVVIALTPLMHIAEVPNYDLGPLPWSWAASDSYPTKTQRDKLLNLMGEGSYPVEGVPPQVAVVVDAMAILQGRAKPPATFGGVVGGIQLYVRVPTTTR